MSIKLPEDLQQLPVFVVLANTPAWNVMMRLAGHAKPGAIIPASEEEMLSLKADVICIQAPKDEAA